MILADKIRILTFSIFISDSKSIGFELSPKDLVSISQFISELFSSDLGFRLTEFLIENMKIPKEKGNKNH